MALHAILHIHWPHLHLCAQVILPSDKPAGRGEALAVEGLLEAVLWDPMMAAERYAVRGRCGAHWKWLRDPMMAAQWSCCERGGVGPTGHGLWDPMMAAQWSCCEREVWGLLDMVCGTQ